MGGGKGASSSQTVSIPPEVLARYNSVNARAENVATTPFTPYSTSPEAFVAPLSASQQAGIANVNALQGAANQAVGAGQGLQGQGIESALQARGQAQGVDLAALQGISRAQQQGQQYLRGATGLTRQALETGQQFAGQAQPFYTGALGAAQPLNQAAQQYMQAGTQAVTPEALNYGQYMNPYMKDVVQAQQALQSQENAQQRAAMQGKAIQSGAFGSDRAGIEQANLARQQSLANQATLANLLQSGYGQAQQMAAQQQGVGLSAAQANRAAQAQAAQQAAALGQQQYGQQLGLGQALAALGQQQYGQQLGAGAQMGQLGQQGYAQGIGGAQAAAGIGQNLYGMGAQTAGLQQAGGMNVANLGLQNQAAQIAAAQAQMAAGQQQQQTGQAAKTALYNQFLQQQGYPFQIAQFLANIAMGTGSLSGSTTTSQRTGYRGGRMGDGYASGGLVPPDSQGGAVYEPGLYGRGGYEDGGAPDYDSMVRQAYAGIGRSGIGSAPSNIDQAGLDYWKGQLQSGAIAPEDFNAKFNQGVQGFIASSPNDPVSQYVTNYQNKTISPATSQGLGAAAPSTGDNSQYDQIIRNAYAGIGRSGIGSNASNIDQPGYNYWLGKLQSGALTPENFNAQFSKEAEAYAAANPNSPVSQFVNYQAVANINPDIASAFKDATGKDIDAASARKYQDMLNSGMSLDQIKYNITNSQPALLKSGDVGALKGQSLAYNPANFGQPAPVTYNRFGAFSAGDFTPQMPQATGKGGQPMMGGYGGYGGGYGGYGGYAMPNFGMSQQYGGAPDYASAAYYGGMPNYGYGYQQPRQATGKGIAPSQPQYNYQQAPQATGKGASQAPTATGKGMNAGGRAGFADGGRTGYAAGGDPASVLRALAGQYNPGDPFGTVATQQASFANAPGAASGYVPAMQPSVARQLMAPQKSILPEQKSGIKEAIGMGTSIASLGEAGTKLYDKLKAKFEPETPKAMSSTTTAVPQKTAGLDMGTLNNAPMPPKKLSELAGLNPDEMTTPVSAPEATGKGVSMAANGGRIGLATGGIPGLDDLKQGYAPTPGGEGEETPISKVVEQGTQTPAELKGQMDKMSAGSGGLGGGSSSNPLGTASSLMSLGSMAMSAGSWIGSNILPFFFLASGGRVGKADGGALMDTDDPKYRQMEVAFDNLLQRYDNNPLLAAAAMDVGTKVVDEAIRKAEQTGGDITDFLPRRTQEYMFALSKAALGAHDAINREVRAAGGRTGYALPGSVDDQPTGLAPAPAPSDAMTMGDVTGGLAPTGERVQLAGEPPTAANKGPDYDAIINRASKETGIPADLLRAQIKQESGFNPNATGKAGEIGLTQILPSTAKKPGFGMAGVDPETLRDPEQNILFGAKYLAARGQSAGVKDWNNPQEAAKGLRAYNGGGDPNYVANVYRHMGLTPPANVGEQKPTQVATATGLAPKTDAGPFERTVGKILPDAVPTDSSFWVPLIAGLGTMLASDKYRFSQRLGEGLVGGAAAYGKQQEFGLQQQKVASEVMKNTLGVASDRFKPIGGGQWWDTLRGEAISTEEYQNRLKAMPGMAPYMGAATAGAGAPGAAPAATKPSTTQTPAAEQKTEAQPATTQKAAVELPKNVADVQAIYNQVDAIPEVADAKKTYQDLAKQANDPAIVASGQSTALRTQAAQALSVYNDLRNKYASVAMEEAKKKLELSPEMVEAKAGEAASIESAKNNIKYFDEQSAADQARQQTRVQLGAIRSILENYQSGTFAQEKAQLVGALRAAGINVPSSATADPDAFEEFTKEMMKNVFSGVKEIGGQIRVAEMAGLEKASNNPSMQPEANKKVLAQALGILNAADKRYADEVNAYEEQKNKFNRAKFQLDWRKSPENDPQKFISEAEKNTAVRGATPSDLSEMSAGHVYVIEPNNAFGVAIDKPQKLRFMGVNPETGNPRWQKVQ